MNARVCLALGSLTLLSLGIYGCSSAAAADGEASSRSTQSALASPANARAPAVPVDAPPPGHKPPQEAFDACKGSTEGATCSVSFHGHTMTGTCKKGPNGEQDLACVPDHPPGPPPAGAGEIVGSAALEHRLDRLEKDIQSPEP